jgi:hypothetical protein
MVSSTLFEEQSQEHTPNSCNAAVIVFILFKFFVKSFDKTFKGGENYKKIQTLALELVI